MCFFPILVFAIQDNLWEETCLNPWPSTWDTNAKKFISYQLSGFRNLYASCFHFIDYDQSESPKSNSRPSGLKNKVYANNPSDFVCLTNVKYKNDFIYSKVLWGIPIPGNFEGWFYNCPFRIDLINFDEDYVSPDELHTIVLGDINKGSEYWGHLVETIRLN